MGSDPTATCGGVRSHTTTPRRLLVDRIFSVQTDYVDVIQDEIDTALHAAGDRERPEELRKTLTTVSRKVDSEVTTSDGSVFFVNQKPGHMKQQRGEDVHIY